VVSVELVADAYGESSNDRSLCVHASVNKMHGQSVFTLLDGVQAIADYAYPTQQTCGGYRECILAFHKESFQFKPIKKWVPIIKIDSDRNEDKQG